ncbi:MAG: hypothetical protein OH319_02270 [Candidatus Parvarchaeota archaeon]|nr:hypothetical protein [Candidatus Jingweiarchaeum tengchongense]MCW1298193.1 hypothetical protein [Candidatus Jingweiarchaeum tengchongense]MCW1299991.1 hypothetical protein [Candidatus Jingweiarchaeum tengchongense]MCW1305019.1 hypothetical protein [Candidatus Jingweiarchaeum tengchongense]MCW1305460.1 hypothetical protein [Candidatus Jingweiarchaeum tengchongense]
MSKDGFKILQELRKKIVLVLVILFALLIALWLYLSRYANKATMHTPYE